MIVGVDAGGTNTDGVLLDESEVIDKKKIPHSEGMRKSIREVISGLLKGRNNDEINRVVIGSTVILNAFLEKKVPSNVAILMPGPGLSPDLARAGEENEVLQGYIDHRGRKVEDLDSKKVKEIAEEFGEKRSFSVVAKFSPRNPILENEIAKYLDDRRTTLGHQLGGRLNFPLRSSSAVINSKSKPAFFDFREGLKRTVPGLGDGIPLYFLKSDGAMINDKTAEILPSLTIKSGPAGSIFGLWALTGEAKGLAVDIGGTTTDIGIIKDGKVSYGEDLEVDGLNSFFPSIEALDIPLGGDLPVRLEDGKVVISGQREGPAAAFGGDQPTLTDALHVLGTFEEGSADRAREKMNERFEGDTRRISRKVLDKFAEEISTKLRELLGERKDLNRDDTKLLGGGVLSRYVLPKVKEKTGMEFRVPPNSEVAGAVGCAVSRPSLETSVRIDSARGEMIVNGEKSHVEEGKTFDPEELKETAKREALKNAKKMGGKTEEIREVEILDMRFFNVVKGRRVRGQICDVKAQVKPGLSASLDSAALRRGQDE